MNESTLVPREEMSDLDWLARNVHVWPRIAPKVISAGDELFEFGATFYNDWVDIYGKFAGCGVTITKQQWLSRRAELQNKPSWDLSGSWSEYLAQDMDGEWKWLGENPSLGDEYWTADELRSQCKGVVIGDWRDTLEKRPEQAKPEFCESVMRSIPEPEAKPTIEQLAAEYRNAKGYAERKQEEADAAKADAEAKLKALELAGEALGLLVSPINAKQKSELAIEVKVGDEVECIKSIVNPDKYVGKVGTVFRVDDSSPAYLVDLSGEKVWCHYVKFIHRPS